VVILSILLFSAPSNGQQIARKIVPFPSTEYLSAMVPGQSGYRNHGNFTINFPEQRFVYLEEVPCNLRFLLKEES
jgi:hypothetical protein